MIKGIILCEGATDQVLIGAYLSEIKSLSHTKLNNKDNPFPLEHIVWFADEHDDLIGILDVGGNDFTSAICTIMGREKKEHTFESVVVVTDYDDAEEVSKRSQETYKTISNTLGIKNVDERIENNVWHNLVFDGAFSNKEEIRYCFLLVPFDSQGSLETYMLEALSEHNEDKKIVIEQVKVFLQNLKTDTFLKKRRERIKADLSVSIGIFIPDKMFNTLTELINSIDWSEFDTSKKQFKILTEI